MYLAEHLVPLLFSFDSKRGIDMSCKALTDQVNTRVGHYTKIRRFLLMDDIPVSADCKVLEKAFRESPLGATRESS